jgi:serralysin
LLASFYAFPGTFRGGLYVAAGDVNGDGRADVIVGAGPGTMPQVTVFDGRGLTLLESFFAFPTAFHGGVRVGAVDVNGDGRADIRVASGPGTTPQVSTFDGSTLALLGSFFAYDPTFKGGVQL